MGVRCVCMHKHARLGGSGGICSPRRFLEIRCSMIASEAILGQKQSRSSYMACGVLHLIFGCARMHLLTSGVTSLGRQLVNSRLVSSVWNVDLFTHIFTRVLSPQQRKQLMHTFRAGPPRTNSHSCNQTRLHGGDSQYNSETSEPISNKIFLRPKGGSSEPPPTLPAYVPVCVYVDTV